MVVFPVAGQPVAQVIHFPAPESADDHSYNDYALSLLQLALTKAGARYQVRVADAPMKQSRAALEIANMSGMVDIMATMTSSEREVQLLPVRIPITKGLMGWRISLLPMAKRDQWLHVSSAHDLEAFEACQGHDWPDIDILRANGLPVRGVANFDGMFRMLELNRIDYFPRPIITVWNEARTHARLVVDANIVLHFPVADYFFVNRNNAPLAEAVRKGLEMAIADGSFDRLFYAHYAAAILQADLPHRRIIELRNPRLGGDTPLKRAALWFSLDDLDRAKLAASPR